MADGLAASEDDGASTDELKNECQRHAFSNGEFFQIDFEHSVIDGKIIGFCQLCVHPAGKVSASFKDSSNFAKHIKKHHPTEVERYKRLVEVLKINFPRKDNRGPTARCVFDQEVFNTNIANFILDSGAPLDTVAKPSFRKIFDDFKICNRDMTLKHMSRRKLVRKIETIFKQDMKTIKDALSSVKFVSTTADIWSYSHRRVIGCTANWIDPTDFKLKSAGIACKWFPNTHNAESIAQILLEINASFGLDEKKVVCTVTDNAANFAKCFRDFGVTSEDAILFDAFRDEGEEEDSEPMNIDQIDDNSNDEVHEEDTDEEEDSEDENEDSDEDSNSESENPPAVPLTENEEEFDDLDFDIDIVASDAVGLKLPLQMRCAAHTMNLVGTVDMMRNLKLDKTLYKSHTQTVARCSELWKKSKFPKAREAIKTELDIALIRPIVTRWNSLHDSLKQLNDLKGDLTRLCTILEVRVLTAANIKYIANYVKCTTPISRALDRLQGDVPYAYLLPTLLNLKRDIALLQEEYSREDEKYLPLLTSQLDGLDKRFGDYYQLNDIAIPAAVASFFHPMFKDNWLKRLDASVRQELADKIIEVAVKEAQISAENSAVDERVDSVDSFLYFSPDDTMEIDRNLHCTDVHNEISKYLKDKRRNIEMINDYPLLKEHVFFKFNTPTPSSASVERLFSYATLMGIPKYNRLTAKNFEIRVLSLANKRKIL